MQNDLLGGCAITTQREKCKRNAHINRLKSAAAAAGLHLDSTEAQNRQTRSSHQNSTMEKELGTMIQQKPTGDNGKNTNAKLTTVASRVPKMQLASI